MKSIVFKLKEERARFHVKGTMHAVEQWFAEHVDKGGQKEFRFMLKTYGWLYVSDRFGLEETL